MKNKLEKFYKTLNTLNEKEYIENYLLYLLAPVISGVKPSSTINFKKEGKNLYALWNTFGEDFIKELGLCSVTLRELDGALVKLIYNRESLEKYLNIESHKKFLISLGYNEDDSLEDLVETLRCRYEIYHCPHELGLFLGIPIEDVVDFMECTPKKCLLCGYWKVYNNHQKAVEIFKEYDRCKEYIINEILENFKYATNKLHI